MVDEQGRSNECHSSGCGSNRQCYRCITMFKFFCVCARISSLAGIKRRVAVFTKIYRLCGSDFTTVAVILNGEEINGSRTTTNALWSLDERSFFILNYYNKHPLGLGCIVWKVLKVCFLCILIILRVPHRFWQDAARGLKWDSVTLFLPNLRMLKYVFTSMQTKIVVKSVYWGLNNCTEIVSCPLMFQMTRMEMDCILKHFASIFQTSPSHLWGQTENELWITLLAYNWLMSWS